MRPAKLVLATLFVCAAANCTPAAPAPTVSALSKTAGALAGGTTVGVTGTGFQTGAQVTFAGTPATAVSVLSATSLTCVTPAHAAGVVDVVVSNPGGLKGTLAGSYTYEPGPTISSLSVSGGPPGFPLTITGTGFLPGVTVALGGALATSVVVAPAGGSISCVTSAHAAGAVDVVVTNVDGQSATPSNAFVFLNPWNGTRQLGVASAATAGNAVATDTSANVFVAGSTAGGLDGNTLTGTHDFFVTKYDSSGIRQWTQQLGVTAADTFGIGVATDSQGSAFVGGATTSGLDGNALTGSEDLFVTKYDASGTKQWTRQLGVTSQVTSALSVATDVSGNIFVAGFTTGGLDGNVLTGTNDFFVTKYSGAGAKQWTRQLGVAAQSTFGQAVAADASGDVFVAGVTGGGLDGNSLTGLEDFFLTKYDGSGNKQWTRQLGVAAHATRAQGVAADGAGNVFVAGVTKGGLDGNTLTGASDFFVTKYDGSGNKQWTRQLGVPAVGTGAGAVATDSAENVFVAGQTQGGLDGNTLTGTIDLFVAQYDGSGNKKWIRQLGAPGAQSLGQGVATDSAGNSFVGGTTAGDLDGNTLAGLTDFFLTKYDGSGTKQ